MGWSIAFKLTGGLLAALGSLALAVPLWAAAAELGEPELPLDPATTDVSLLTHAPGDTIRSAWGHVALRVRDAGRGTDLVFDWGMDELGESLWSTLAFLRGTPTYRLSIQAYQEMLRDYGAVRRTIEENPLRLSRTEKARLIARLAWNARPEHRPYSYAVFGDNCATRIRDLLDHALGGRLAERLAAMPGGGSRRAHVRSSLRSRPWLGWGLDPLLGAEADRSLSAWEELFLPEQLRAHLRITPASAEAAGPSVGLLGDTRVVLAPPAGPGPGPQRWVVVLSALSPLAVGGVALARARRREGAGIGLARAGDAGKRWRSRGLAGGKVPRCRPAARRDQVGDDPVPRRSRVRLRPGSARSRSR